MITKADHVKIHLDDKIRDWCDRIAKKRIDNNRNNGGFALVNNAPGGEEEAIKRMMHGVPCECAAAYYFKPCDWTHFREGPPNRDLPDIDDFIDVKGIVGRGHRLVIPPMDVKSEWAYLLVLNTTRNAFTMIGWAWGDEIKAGPKDNPKGNREAFFIPQDHEMLKPPRDLLKLLRERQDARSPKPIFRCCVCNEYATQTLAIHNPNQKPLPPMDQRLWYCFEHLPRSPDAKPNPAVATA